MTEVKVKEDLSRMEGTYGAEMIGKLKQMRVLISGLRGLGIETAKNLVLAGPHTVNIHDDVNVAIADLGTNFYLHESDVGKPRAASCLAKLVELNPNVNVSTITGALTEEVLDGYDVVCLTDCNDQKELVRISNHCHNTKRGRPIVFMYGSILGAQASLFVDYGDNHKVFDIDGEPLKTLVVDHITNDATGRVIIDGDRHLLSDGDHIKIEDVLGMSEGAEARETPYGLDEKIANINSSFVIKGTKNPKIFNIGDTSGLGPYKSGGVIYQQKQNHYVSQKTFESQLTHPTFEMGYMDFSKLGREYALHFVRLAIFRYAEKTGELPALHSEKAADECMKYAKELLAEYKEVENAVQAEIDESLVRQTALYARAENMALSALFGGVLAQEITKQTGKYKPLDQWLHFDAFEILDAKVPVDAAPLGTRYDHQIALFGKAFQDRLGAQNCFLVGCGALGCEYLKAVALLGLGVNGGSVTITDDDTIELSNLSRQFLFRREHVGKLKSESAAGSAVAMNPEIEKGLTVQSIRVEPKTEDTFDDAFWEKLDFVLNALDNNHARVYTDGKCVLYGKPLFESGTLGTKANSVICLPGKTPSYAEGVVAGEDGGIAKCTLRNFPSLPLHCIEWAREKFDDWFVVDADNVNSFLENKKAFFDKVNGSPLEARGTLEQVTRWLDLSKAPTLELCVSLVQDEFIKCFRNQIRDLCHLFPEDARIEKKTDDGQVLDLGAFWHGHKRFPQAFEYDAKNPLHSDYVYHGSCVMASVMALPEPSKQQVEEIAAGLASKIPAWAYKGNKVDVDEKKEASTAPVTEDVSEEDEEVVKRLLAELDTRDVSAARKLVPADFEKDDASNHHVDVIAAATNLRSQNYYIKESSLQECRMVAGKIIPAIATTTAMITGFVLLELYKYIKQSSLECYRQATCNLGVNSFTLEYLPDPIKKKSGFDRETYMEVKAIPEGWTVWDRIDIEAPNCTLEEFFDKFKTVQPGVVIDCLTNEEGKLLYMETDQSTYQNNRKRKLVDIYEELNEGPVHPPSRRFFMLECSGEDEDGNTALLPKIKYTFK